MDSSTTRPGKLNATKIIATICFVAAAAIGASLVMGKDPFVRGFVKKDFEQDGLQIGQQIPDELTVFTLEGEEIPLREYCAEGPTLIVTGSLTCHVSRDGCKAEIAKIAEEIAPNVRTVLLYTIDAHPVEDVSPYAEVEWVTTENEEAGILERQPTNLEERTALASKFVETTEWKHGMVVDTMQNSAWKALGNAPNCAILVNAEGTVFARNGWFNHDRMQASVNGVAEKL